MTYRTQAKINSRVDSVFHNPTQLQGICGFAYVSIGDPTFSLSHR